ncbi:MAG: ferredoxin [Cyanobacteria bacterium J06623_4]
MTDRTELGQPTSKHQALDQTPSFTADVHAQRTDRSGLEPELGGQLRSAQQRTGLEPELGGAFRQNGVYVDEPTCIGCTHCAHVARNTFYIEPEYGRARVIRQDGDSEALIQEAIDTCPVDCIHWVDYTELRQLERDRKHQVIPLVGFPVDKATVTVQQRQKKQKQS